MGTELVFREAAAKDLLDYSQGLNFTLPSFLPFLALEKEAIHNAGLACSLPASPMLMS